MTDKYSIYVVGDSMEPAHVDGGLLFIDPDRTAAIGDDLLVCLKGEAERVMLRRLVDRDARSVTVRRYNPKQDTKISLEQIAYAHTVMTMNEIAGAKPVPAQVLGSVV